MPNFLIRVIGYTPSRSPAGTGSEYREPLFWRAVQYRTLNDDPSDERGPAFPSIVY
jgi:hypothetical protein